MEKHILICGERGVGKSTLIRRLLAESTLPVGGFVTRRLPQADGDGMFPIYLHAAALPPEERPYDPEHLVGTCDSRRSIRYPEAFDRLGPPLLTSGGLLVMDELGFLENDAHRFQAAVLAALDGSTPVRDRVLVLAEDILRQSRDMEEARQRLAEALPQLQQTAAEEIAAQGSRYTVSAGLEETEFPTREYDGFALPSGEYLALRVVIGEGAGKNWWCVVFPPLCTTAACDFQETAVSGGLGEEDLSLITEEDGGYVLRFRAVELWEGLRQWLGKH